MRNDCPMTTSKRTTFIKIAKVIVDLWNLDRSKYANLVSPCAMTVMVHFVTTDARIVNTSTQPYFTDSCTYRLMTVAFIRLTRKDIKMNEVGQLRPVVLVSH